MQGRLKAAPPGNPSAPAPYKSSNLTLDQRRPLQRNPTDQQQGGGRDTNTRDRDRDRDRTGTALASRGAADPNADRGGGGHTADDHHRKGYEYRRNGDFQSAIEHYSEAINLDPKHFKAMFNRAFAYDKMGRYQEAVDDYTTALTIEPSNAFAYYNRGISHDRRGRYDLACEDFRKAIRIQPTNLDFLHNLALCLRKQGNIPEAADAYTQCLRVDPNHLKARHSRGLCYEQLNRPQEALAEYNIVLDRHPHHIPCLTCKAHVLQSLGGQANLQLAIRTFSVVLDELYPDGHDTEAKRKAVDVVDGSSVNSDRRRDDAISIIHARAKAYESLGDIPSAIRDVTLAIGLAQEREETPTAPARVRDTDTVQHDGDPPYASLPLSLLLSTRALYFKTLDKHSNAIDDLSSAIEGLLKEQRRGSDHDARDVYSMNYPVELATAYNHRGYCWRKLENYQQAIKDYTCAIREQPRIIKGYNNRAYCLAKVGKYSEAVEDYSAVISIDPLNSHAYHNRGISLDKLGLFDKAIEDFSKVSRLI
jgi:tetratricopeptide (TPR) repeat protein